MLSKTIAKTQALAAPLLGLVLLIGANGAEAKGCIKGAVVGGVAGHVAGHHGVLGAAAGCAVGHHLAKKKQQQLQQQQQQQPQQRQPPPQQSAQGRHCRSVAATAIRVTRLEWRPEDCSADRVRPLNERAGVVSLGTDRPRQRAAVVLARAKLLDDVSEVVLWLPPK